MAGAGRVRGLSAVGSGEVLNTFNVLNHFYGGKISMGYILKAFRTTYT